ncbi:Calcineurin subunit B [Balamuthia mandrillaris]
MGQTQSLHFGGGGGNEGDSATLIHRVNTNGNSADTRLVLPEPSLVEFNRKELTKIMKEFKRAIGSSKNAASREVFLKLLVQWGITEALADRFFNVFDRDQNGFIDFSEFARGMSALCRGNRQERIDFAFKVYDLDGDGFVQLEEVKELIPMLLRSEQSILEHESREHLGRSVEDVLSLEEFGAQIIDEEESALQEVLTAFKKADLNSDGKLSREEFTAFVEENADLVANFFNFFAYEDIYERRQDKWCHWWCC